MDNFGVISLIPAIFVIVFALYARKTFEALILGSILTYIIVYKGAFFNPWLDSVYEVLMDGDTVWCILVFGLFGSLIVLLEKSRGTLGFTKLILKIGNTPKKSLMSAWILGIIIFIDDYLNVLTIGSTMRDVTDKHKVPREMLAYVIDSTGAPVCVLIPLSTWAIYFGTVFGQQPELAHLGSGMDMYLKSLPFVFYGWTALLVVPLVILGIIPAIGPMKKAYERVKNTGRTYSERSEEFNTISIECNRDSDTIALKDTTTREKEESKPEIKLRNFIIPMIILIGITIWTEDILVGVIYAVVSAAILYIPFKVMNFDIFSKSLIDGFANMMPMIAILVGAFLFKTAATEIGLPNYVIEVATPFLSPSIFPALTFLIVAALAFITGSNWGVPAVTVPIIAPLAIAVGANPYLALAAIVSGGTFGSHACFYSDATVLTSSASRIDNLEHAFTQFPYALISAIAAIVLYLVFGFIM